MKTLALLLFLIAGPAAAFADTELLQNGDFSDGITHWEGDCHNPGSSSDDSGASSGVVVKLRGDWTKVSQVFSGKSGNYILTITYVVTPGLTLSDKPEDYQNTPSKMELNGLGPVDTTAGKWCIMVVDSGANKYEYWQITPSLNATGVQTIKAQVSLPTGEDNDKGFYLGFPPGDGTINLRSIMLAPVNG